jgi:small-conductance mechanosensitive channel
VGNWLIDDWRDYVTRHRLIVAIVAGLVATHVTTNLGMWYHGLGLPDLNFDYLNGLLVFGNSGMDPKGMSDPVILTAFGAGVHYAQGVCFALIYVFGIHPLLPIANTFLGNFAKAIIWGLILATISAVWWINLFPNLAGPGKSAGIFMTNLGSDWWKWLIAVYLWHIVYGFTLGSFYQPKDVTVTQEA